MLSSSLVLFVNIGAGRPNVSGLNVCAFPPVLLGSVFLSHLSSWSFFSSWSRPRTASWVLRTARCPGWRRLTGCATVGTKRIRRELHRKKYKCNSAHDYKLHSGVYGACLLTFLLRRACRPSFSVSSLTGKALGRSCLLANTSKTASFNSSSVN